MECPHCSNSLVTLEFSRIEVDYCYECKGIWLDSGELEYLFALEGRDDRYVRTMEAANVREKGKRCPLCRKVMEKIFIGVSEKVLLDRCKVHGIWFDRGELKKLLASSCAEGRESPLVRLLDEMFAAQKSDGRCL